MPAKIPAESGAPEAKAIPKHKGMAIKKTTTPASRSSRMYFLVNILVQLNLNIYLVMVINIEYYT